MTDTLRDEIAAAFAAAHVPAHALDDAVAIFLANARHEQDGWCIGSLIKASPSRAVAKFLETRPHFVGSAPRDDEPAQPSDDHWPRDADGKRVPVGEMLDDQLWEAAGEPPEGYYRERPMWDVKSNDFAHSGIQPLDDDEYEADELRPPRYGKHYSKSEVDAMDTNQLFAAAGPTPSK